MHSNWTRVDLGYNTQNWFHGGRVLAAICFYVVHSPPIFFPIAAQGCMQTEYYLANTKLHTIENQFHIMGGGTLRLNNNNLM